MFTFLEELNRNNSKEWMDLHRQDYKDLKISFISWLNELDAKFAQIDKAYASSHGKPLLNRINNNLLFHPGKPVYKDHFGAGLDAKPNKGDFYIQLGIRSSLVAGGFYRPNNSILTSIRSAIDYNGEEFMEILQKESFIQIFGNLISDDRLKTAPRGYGKNHPYIELLKNKSFAVQVELTKEQILSNNFQLQLVEIYKEMLPFRNYLNEAITV